MVERMLCMYEVPGSIPGISTLFLFPLAFVTNATDRHCSLDVDVQSLSSPFVKAPTLLEEAGH